MQILKNFKLVLFIIGLIFIIPREHLAQKKSSYNMEFVRAVQLNSGDSSHIVTIFKVTPTIKKFKLIMSMRVTYEIGQGEKVVNVAKQVEDNIRIAVYGKTMEEKNRILYNLIKDKVRFETEDDIRLIAFDFYNITNRPIDNMSITYGLWESNNSNIRHEKKYDFIVEQID